MKAPNRAPSKLLLHPHGMGPCFGELTLQLCWVSPTFHPISAHASSALELSCPQETPSPEPSVHPPHTYTQLSLGSWQQEKGKAWWKYLCISMSNTTQSLPTLWRWHRVLHRLFSPIFDGMGQVSSRNEATQPSLFVSPSWQLSALQLRGVGDAFRPLCLSFPFFPPCHGDYCSVPSAKGAQRKPPGYAQPHSCCPALVGCKAVMDGGLEGGRKEICLGCLSKTW